MVAATAAGFVKAGKMPCNQSRMQAVFLTLFLLAHLCINVEPASTDVEADGPGEPTGRLSNVCCWSTRAAARELLAPTRATDAR